MMSKLIYRHFAAGKRAIFFSVCVSLAIFAVALLLHLSTIFGNLKDTGITEHPVYPYLFSVTLLLSAMTPMLSDFVSASIKSDYASGFARYISASPVTPSEDVFSCYAAAVLHTLAMLLLTAAYLAVFIALGVIKLEPAVFLPLIVMGVADISVIAVMIPCMLAKDEIKAYFLQFIIIALPLILFSESPGDEMEAFITKLSAMFNIFPAAGAAISAVVPALFLFISFAVSIKIKKGRLYSDG